MKKLKIRQQSYVLEEFDIEMNSKLKAIVKEYAEKMIEVACQYPKLTGQLCKETYQHIQVGVSEENHVVVRTPWSGPQLRKMEEVIDAIHPVDLINAMRVWLAVGRYGSL